MELTTPSGKKIIVKITPEYKGAVRLWVELPEVSLKGQATGPLPLKTPKQGATHYLSLGKQAIGLDAANAHALLTAIDAHKQAYQQSAEGQMDALRQARENLILEQAGWLDAMGEAREQAYQQDTGAGWDKANDYRAKAEAITQKIAAFDAAHPEVVAAIKAEKAEQVRRFLAND